MISLQDLATAKQCQSNIQSNTRTLKHVKERHNYTCNFDTSVLKIKILTPHSYYIENWTGLSATRALLPPLLLYSSVVEQSAIR